MKKKPLKTSTKANRNRWHGWKRTEKTEEVSFFYIKRSKLYFLEPKDPSADTFTEKLVAQIIKNLQIKIRNIHVRYEDKYTDAKRPFAAGVTLESLDFEVGIYLQKTSI
jgi:vacuolar protein sorting-associated protein 13A/C